MKILIKNQQRHRSLDKPEILGTARNILSLLKQNQPGTELSILFVGDRKMKQLNSDYRGIKKTTDVLSFEGQIPLMNEETGNILGDIVISVPKADSQAEEYGTSFNDEICRLLIHGTLHLLGYDHEQSKKEAQKMRRKEREIFNALTKVDQER